MATTLMPELPKEFLAAARKGREYALDAIKVWVEIVQSVTPKVPAARIPFAGRLPKPEAVVAGYYDFAGQLLASQRHFAEELLKATAPLRPAISGGHGAPKVVPIAPKAAEAAPKVVPIAPKAAEAAPAAAPKAAEAAPKVVPVAPKAAEAAPAAAPKAAEAAPEVVPVAPKAAEAAPEVVPVAPKAAEAAPKVVPAAPKAASAAPKAPTAVRPHSTPKASPAK